MKKKVLYMFFILQLLFVITNYKDIDTQLFSIQALDILKIIILIFSSLYITFYIKNKLKPKMLYLLIITFTFLSFFIDGYSTSQLLTNLYYISTFSFLIFYYLENKIDKYKIILISYITLLFLDISTIINYQSSISIELLINILLSFIIYIYSYYKKLALPLIILTIVMAFINDMNFVLYNFLFLSLITLISSKNKKDILYNSFLFLCSILLLIFKDLLSFNSLYDTLGVFKTNVIITSFVIAIPLISIVCNYITKYIIQKKNNVEYNLYLYTSFVIVALLFISLNNVYNEFVIIAFAYLFILIIDKYNNDNKHFKEEITFFVLHLGYGGIESSTINTANELSKFYKVNIVSFYKLKRNITSTINKDISIKYLYKKEPNKEDLINSIKNKNIIKILSNGLLAIKILFLKQYLNIKEMYNCDSKYVVSTRNEYSILLSEFGNTNAIKIAQEHMHHRDNKKYINNIKYGFNNIDYLFALTESLKKDYLKFLKNNKHTKVVVVPNIIYLPKKRSKLNNKNLITISRLNPIKKIEDMIDIFSKIKSKKSKLYIVGDGEELPKLKSIVDKDKLNDKVIFTGYKTKEEMEEYICDSSIFLLTSWSEGLPMVLLEAMSYGVPCIAFSTKSGVSDIIDDNVNGFIINNRNKNKYIEKIDELLNNKELLNEFSSNSIIKAKKFTAKEIIKKWQEVLENEK